MFANIVIISGAEYRANKRFIKYFMPTHRPRSYSYKDKHNKKKKKDLPRKMQHLLKIMNN